MSYKNLHHINSTINTMMSIEIESLNFLILKIFFQKNINRAMSKVIIK